MIVSRREKISKYITDMGEVSIRSLEKEFPDVSTMTIRRDLAYLEEQGLVIRTRGSVKSLLKLTGNGEDIYSLRATKNIDAKIKVAKKALKYVETGRSIFIDSGTTTMCLAKILPDDSLSIITSGPNISMEIIKKNNPSVTLVGGQLSRNNLTTSGMSSINFIKSINIDIAFMAASAFSLKSGFTIGDFNECELKKAVIKRAGKVVLMIDKSKIDKNMPFTFATLKDIDVLISDSAFPEQYVEALKKNNVKIE